MNTVFEIRSALQWSQSKLADEIGVSFATVNRWENEKSTPNRSCTGENACDLRRKSYHVG